MQVVCNGGDIDQAIRLFKKVGKDFSLLWKRSELCENQPCFASVVGNVSRGI